MAELTMPNFAAALPEPRVTLPDDARSNTGLALASGALNSITSIANNYMQARQTKDQASAIGEAMLGSSDPSVQEAGRMYKSLSKTMPVNYFAISGANGRNSTGAVQGGMLDDAIKLIRDQQLQSQRKELLELEQSSRERLLGLESASRLDYAKTSADLYDRNASRAETYRRQTNQQDAVNRARLQELGFVNQAILEQNPAEAQKEIIKNISSGAVAIKDDPESQEAWAKFAALKNPSMKAITNVLPALEKTASRVVHGAKSTTSTGVQTSVNSYLEAKKEKFKAQ